MWNILFILVLTAFYLSGYFIINRLDRIFDLNWDFSDSPAPPKQIPLRLGFSSPLTADCILCYQQQFFKAHANVEVYLYTDKDAAIIQGLTTDKIDIGFVSEAVNTGALSKYHIHSQYINLTPIKRCSTNLPADPLNHKQISQQVLWQDAASAQLATEFIHSLYESVKQPSGNQTSNML